VEQVAVGSRAGDPNLRRVCTLRDGLQQQRPLDVVRRVEVHDMQHVPHRAVGGDHPSFHGRSQPDDLLKEAIPTDRPRVGGWMPTLAQCQSGVTTRRARLDDGLDLCCP
jgi:hypothetical protein